MRDGLVVVDKPAGLTSQQAVARIKHRLAAQWGMRPKTLKVGHAGTLDPLATGVLVIGVGKATKVLGAVAGDDKCYEATIRLGQSTTTDDGEGEPIETVAEPVSVILTAHEAREPGSREMPGDDSTDAAGYCVPQDDVVRAVVTAAMAELTGDILQVPSSVSAIKVDGKRAYALVRAGESVELKPRPVHVARFDAVAFRDAAPFLDVDVVVDCTSGTYVRALARDLGARLGVGGHVTALRRTRVGTFGIDQSVALEDVTESSLRPANVIPPPPIVIPQNAGSRQRRDDGAQGARTAVALGTFDGVHLGHQAVIAAARRAVGPHGTVTAVTFKPHPMTVVAPDLAPPLLQALAARADALRAAGADKVLALRFTPEMAALSPREFVEKVLSPLTPVAVAVGPGFTFGARAAGTPTTLAELAAGRFDVIVTPTVEIDGVAVSSTVIRAAVMAGDMALATRLLGRDFSVRGVVIHGDQRGRTLGFPTANLAPDDAVVTPPDGTYAGWLRRLDGVSFVPTSEAMPAAAAMPAAISVGDNPMSISSRRVEAHVLDVDIDLYDVPVEIGFVEPLRGMIKFDSVDDLIVQMRQDVADTRRAVGEKERQDA